MRRERGFTLVELLIVVLIIGILATIAIPVFNGQRAKARAAAAQSALRVASDVGRSLYLASPDDKYPLTGLKQAWTAEEAGYRWSDLTDFGNSIGPIFAMTPSGSSDPNVVYLIGNGPNREYILSCNLTREEAFCMTDGSGGAGTSTTRAYGRSRGSLGAAAAAAISGTNRTGW